MASEYVEQRTDMHEVEKVFSGKAHHFNIKTPEGQTHEVSIEVRCDCRYMGVQGIPNGRICTHIRRVMKEMLK